MHTHLRSSHFDVVGIDLVRSWLVLESGTAALPDACQAASMPRVEASTWTMTSHMHRCVRLAEEGALGCRRPLERDAANNPSAALPGVAAVCKPCERDELTLTLYLRGSWIESPTTSACEQARAAHLHLLRVARRR